MHACMCVCGCLHLCALPRFNMTPLTHLAVNFSSSSTGSRGHTSKQLMMIEWERSPSYEPARACSPGFTDTWLGINKRHWIWLPRNMVRHDTHSCTHTEMHMSALLQVCGNNLHADNFRHIWASFIPASFESSALNGICLYHLQSFYYYYYYFIHSNHPWKDCIPTPTGELPSITIP